MATDMSTTMPQPPEVDLNRMITVTLPLHQWNGVLGCLRTGSGPGWTWDFINPLLGAISQQIARVISQPQGFAQQPLPTVATAKPKPNGEDVNVPSTTTY